MCKSFFESNTLKAKTHTGYHHYTNLETLLRILSTESIRLSEISKLNDTIEGSRIEPYFRHKTFVSCFEHNTHESIPMWKMYAKSPYGIRISFSNIDFFENHNAYFVIQDGKYVNFPFNKWIVRHSVLVDIEYLNNINEHVYYIEPLGPEFGKFSKPSDIGFVKNSAWAYENETRVRVFIDVKPGVLPFIQNKNFTFKDHEMIPDYIYPDFEYIYCGLNSNVYKDMSITFYPNMPSEIKRAIILSVRDRLPGFDRFKDSEFDGQIVL